MEIIEIQERLKKTLSKSRYEHTRAVMYTASCLAMAHGVPMKQAMLAGLLHDCAKCIPNDEKLMLCRKYSVSINDAERQNPYLLHAKLGAVLARREYGVMDSDILHSIRVHTTGTVNMSLLDKIIYTADYIEPGRNKAPNLSRIRALAFRNLDVCVAEILYDTLQYLSHQGGVIDDTTRKAYEFYREYQERRDEV